MSSQGRRYRREREYEALERMADDAGLYELFCLNENCRSYKEKTDLPLRLIEQYGKRNIWIVKCRWCKREFGAARYLPTYPLRIDSMQLLATLDFLAQGATIRETAESARLDKNTILKIKKFTFQNLERIYRYVNQTLNNEMWRQPGSRTEEKRLRLTTYLRQQEEILSLCSIANVQPDKKISRGVVLRRETTDRMRRLVEQDPAACIEIVGRQAWWLPGDTASKLKAHLNQRVL